MRQFLTASELSRAINCPLSRVTHALDAGIIAADGRAGNAANAAIIFGSDRLEDIKAALDKGAPAPRPTPSLTTAEISAKAAALNRAVEETK